MRENKFSKKSIGLYYTQFKVKRTIISTVLNALKNNGIKTFDSRVGSKDFAYFSVLNKDEKKVFAIFKEIWYNEDVVSKTRSYGFFYPLSQLVFRLGFFLGIIFFITVVTLSSFYVTNFEFVGSGKEYKREVINCLNANGIYEKKSIKGVDFSAIKNQILLENDNLSFVEIKKDGFRLIVELEIMVEKKPSLVEPVCSLVSDCEGVVVSVKTYRGTPQVKVGDFCKEGDLLVDGYCITNEEKISCNVIASVVILTKTKYEYSSKLDGEEQNALIFAEQSFGEEYEKYEIQKSKSEDGNLYTVWLHFKKEISAT